MEPNSLIPTPDSIPAPAWIFILLEQLLFLLHILLINAVLGGMLVMLFRKSKNTGENHETDFRKNAAKKLPVMIALGINLAIPPLLFLQVVFGHLFYSSSVLMATYWILIIPLLIVAYYGAYIHSVKLFSCPFFSRASLAISILIILYIGFMLVNNNSLMEQPEKWTAYFENRNGSILNLNDQALWPRYIHFIAASLAIGSIFFALMHHLRAKKGEEGSEQKVTFFLRIFAVVTAIQLAVGFWYLLAIPSEFIPAFMGKDLVSTMVLMAGIGAGIGAMISGFLGKFKATVAHLLLTMIAMIISRYNLRMMYLDDNFRFSGLELAPQYGLLALFLLILLIGIALILYMLKIGFNKSERRVEP
ncbi:MAG: hypothetical protein JXA03_04260 [Bacteroidales bacterium]|nr:hypothetical protein [Bacteroidales bacterium]